MVFLFILGISIFGCATPQGRLYTTLDYFLPDPPADKTAPENNVISSSLKPNPYNTPLDQQLEDLNDKIDQLEKTINRLNGKLTTKEVANNSGRANILDHNISISNAWSFVLNNERAGSVYNGLTLTGTTRNNLFSFKLMFTVSKDYLVTSYEEPLNTPDVIKIFVPVETIAQIRSFNYQKDYILMPAITVSILHYKMNFGFGTGSVPNIVARIELRSGLAYDMYFEYTYSDFYISLLDGQEKKLALPSGIYDKSYFSNLTTINFDLAPFHVEANFIFNTREIKTAIGLGLIF